MIGYCLICGEKTKGRKGHLQFAHNFTKQILEIIGINEDVYFLDTPFKFLPGHEKIKWENARTKHNIEKCRVRVLELLEPIPQSLPEPIIAPKELLYDYFTIENIIFGKGYITINGSRTKKIFTINSGKSIEGLNHIKKEFLQFFFIKPASKFFYDEMGLILIDKSKNIQELLEHLETAIEFYAFKKSPDKRGKRFPKKLIEKLSNEQLLNVFPKQNVDKGPFVRHLYSLHDLSFKLIPIMESIGSSHEESFIFRIRNRKDRLFAIWENLNPGRATYIFKLADHRDYLAEILGYIEEHESSKRLYLRVKNIRDNWPERELGFKGFIDHDSFDQFEYDFHRLINS